MSTVSQIEYPESDGRPVGESDLHIDWTFRIRDILKFRYRGQKVYVGSDLFIYYNEGNTRDVVAPDEFVVLDCMPGPRRVFKTWEEQRSPNFVLEITSQSTRREDEFLKMPRYQQMGVPECFLYDPTGEYLHPALAGYTLTPSGYEALPMLDGKLRSRQLGLSFSLNGNDLVLADTDNGLIQLTGEEAERAAKETERAAKETERAEKEAERAAKEVERENRIAAEQRVQELEEELRRLRREQ